MPVSSNIRIANDFFHDSLDFLHRYRLTVEHFYAIRSRRFKLFLDLRMATECILKAYAAYFSMKDLAREEAIARVEGYGHKIKKMTEVVASSVTQVTWQEFSPYIDQLNHLPVGLRYQLDGVDFREVNEELYYKTIGSDRWLDGLHSAVKKLTDELNQHLVSHSRVVSANELREEIMTPSHNKYARRKEKSRPPEA